MIVRKIGKGLLILLGVILLAAAALVIWLTVREFKPEAVKPVPVTGTDKEGLTAQGKPIAPGDELTVLSLNIGYAGLGKDADFFMDGGSGVQPTSENSSENLSRIQSILRSQEADVYFLQEVDSDSKRSYGVDQTRHLWSWLNCNSEDYCYSSAYTMNFSCDYVPYPLPTIGKVHSGIQTITNLEQENARRIALPLTAGWPVSTCNLKRCLLVSEVPLEGTDKKLVLVNLHLAAYDDGAAKVEQAKILMDVLTAEYDKGNYVIAGGDFNQVFPGTLDTYPIKQPELWTPGVLETDMLPAGWQFAYDDSVPTCRLLNHPYDPDRPDTQFYVIDGFILSPNVAVKSVTTLDEQFTYTDHNPVSLTVMLSEE